MDYYKEQMKLHNLYSKLQNGTERLSSNSVESWYEEYVKWMKNNKPHYVDFTNSSMYRLIIWCHRKNYSQCSTESCWRN